ncbi:MAG TPA: AI-2E family transporter [Thermomicrobiales bacterium]|nr:AI-2E family transporter [Thermomicrobiales bacterium]
MMDSGSRSGTALRGGASPAGGAPPAPERRGLTPVSLFLTLLAAYIAYQIQFAVVLVLLALVFATLIERPVQRLEQARVPRSLAILAIYIVTVGAITLLFLLLAPVIREQVGVFQQQAPDQLGDLRRAWQGSGNAILNGPGQDLLGRAIAAIRNPQVSALPFPRDAAIEVLSGAGGALVGMLAVFVITFYYLMEKAWLRTVLLNEIAPAHRARVAQSVTEVEAKVGGWLRGQLALCLVIGVMATVGYGLLDVRFWPLLGLWAGVTEIIPILGPWLGGIPAVVIALTQSWEKALIVAAYAAFIQLLENTTLVPRVMKGAVGLSPLTVFLAILGGTQMLGIAGAILAIPVAAALQVVLSQFFAARKESAVDPSLPGWRWMRGPTAPSPPAVRAGEAPPVARGAPDGRPAEEP